jgi:hypothetical protein
MIRIYGLISNLGIRLGKEEEYLQFSSTYILVNIPKRGNSDHG